MQNKIKNLTKQEIKLLKKHFQILKFNTSFDLVYESQIPNTGIVLLNGELALFKKKKVKFTVRPGSMLGVHMLLNNQTSELGCRIKENSEIIIIHKSDIIEALANKDSELYELLKENLD
jgi:CRP-like cAMP-binding protein